MTSLRGKITGGFLIMAALVICVAVLGRLTIETASDFFTTYKKYAELNATSAQIEAKFLHAYISALNYIADKGSMKLDDFTAQLDAAKRFLEKFSSSSPSGSAKRDIESIAQKLDEFENLMQELLRLREAGTFSGDTKKLLAIRFAADEISNRAESLKLILKGEMDRTGAEALNKLSLFSLLSLAVFAFSGITGIVLATVLTRIILKPLRTISAGIESISQGEGDLTQRIPVSKTRELAALGSSINIFIGSLHDMIVRLKSAIEQNNGISDNLSRQSDTIAGSLGQISSVIQTIGGKMETTGNMIQESSRQVDAIGRQTEDAVVKIEAQSKGVSESSASIEQMIASILSMSSVAETKKEQLSELIHTAQTGTEVMGDTLSKIKNISKSTESIEDLVEIIHSVADRTNILALNAAIEAAHAGDAGKGFAVVADEIGKLATTTALSIKNITENISIIIREIKDAAEFTETTNKLMENMTRSIESVSGSMNEIISGLSELGSGSREITESIKDLNLATAALKDSVHGISHHALAIGESMGRVTEISGQNNEAFTQIITGIQAVSHSGVDLAKLSAENNQISDLIEKDIRHFKTREKSETASNSQSFNLHGYG